MSKKSSKKVNKVRNPGWAKFRASYRGQGAHVKSNRKREQISTADILSDYEEQYLQTETKQEEE